MATYMLKIGKSEVLKHFEKNREVFITNSKVNNNFTARLSIGYAILLTALELANESMKLKLSYDYVLEMLLQNEADSADNMNLSMKAYEHLIQMANANIEHFSLAESRSGIKDASKEIWGIRVPLKTPKLIDGKKCVMLICFTALKFNELLVQKGFEDVSVVIRKLKNDGLLDYEDRRDTRTRKISKSGSPVNLYALRVFESPEDDLGVATVSRKSKTAKSLIRRVTNQEVFDTIFETSYDD